MFHSCQIRRDLTEGFYKGDGYVCRASLLKPAGENRTRAQGLGIFPGGIFAGVEAFCLVLLVAIKSASGLGFICLLLFLSVSLNLLLHPVVWSYCGHGNWLSIFRRHPALYPPEELIRESYQALGVPPSC